MKCKKIILREMYDGLPKKSDFEIVEEEVSEDLKDGEILYKVLYLSVDPFMRSYVPTKGDEHYKRVVQYGVGDTVVGMSLARVTKSKSEKYPVGSLASIPCGWRTGGKFPDQDILGKHVGFPKGYKESSGLGVLGLTGFTAYFGFLDICKPEGGETVMVSAAAGATGTMVGQFAKIKGCRVVGSCGSDEKVEFLKNTIGFDDAFNYKKVSSLDEAVSKMAPNGIDCYYENVGGDLTNAVIRHMNKYGKITICGLVAKYNGSRDTTIQTSALDARLILNKEISVRGFNIASFMQRFPEAIEQIMIWAEEGKLKSYETITEGFENTPDAFIAMLQGKNIGKAVVTL